MPRPPDPGQCLPARGMTPERQPLMSISSRSCLVMRGRRLNSRSTRHVTPVSHVQAVPGPRLSDAVNVRETGTEPTHMVRFEPDHGTTTTTIREKP